MSDESTESEATKFNSARIDESPTKEEVEWIDKQLKQLNETQVGYDDLTPINLVVRDRSGQITAGLNGLTMWTWLYVQTLWVHEEHRNSGIGTRLLQLAENKSKQRGCIGACLSTFSFQAPGFYQRLGYRQCGQIENYPDKHTMHFLVKEYQD